MSVIGLRLKYMDLRIACVPFWYMVLRVPLINIAIEDSKQKKMTAG